MTGYLWAGIGLLVGLGMTALGDMASEEIRDRLDHMPHAILRLAARRLTPSQRTTIYQDEWLPELTHILRGAEARPITRLITGAIYALGILSTADQISRRLDRSSTEQAMIPGNSSTHPVWVRPHNIRVYVEGGSEGDFVKAFVKGHYRRPPQPH
jgi:hypothetical protein